MKFQSILTDVYALYMYMHIVLIGIHPEVIYMYAEHAKLLVLDNKETLKQTWTCKKRMR